MWMVKSLQCAWFMQWWWIRGGKSWAWSRKLLQLFLELDTAAKKGRFKQARADPKYSLRQKGPKKLWQSAPPPTPTPPKKNRNKNCTLKMAGKFLFLWLLIYSFQWICCLHVSVFLLLFHATCTIQTFERMRSLGICQSRANYLKTMDAIGKHLFTTVFFYLIMKIMGKIIFKTMFRCPHDAIIRSKYNIQQITRILMFKFKFLVPRG